MGNILDLLLTTDSSFIESVCISTSSSLYSDHMAVFFHLFCSSTTFSRSSSHFYINDYSKADWDGLVDSLLDNDFGSCFDDTDIDST